jgi:hypothetical protein
LTARSIRWHRDKDKAFPQRDERAWDAPTED